MALVTRSISFPFRGFAPFGADLVAATILRERTSRVVPLERSADSTRRTLAALDSLRAPVEDVRSAARALTLGAGVTYGVTSSNSNVVTGIGSEDAAPGNYELAVTSLARGSSYSFAGVAEPFTSTESLLAPKLDDKLTEKARSVSFTIGSDVTQESFAIEITSSTTIENFVDKFNAASSRASAELVNVGTTSAPNYSVVIRSNEIGTTLGYLSIDVGEALQDPNGDGEKGDGPFVEAIVVQAENARFSLGGVAGSFERESNTVTDAIAGVTLLLSGTGNGSLTVTADTATATSRAQALVGALNRLTDFVETRNGFERGVPSLGGGAIRGPLRGTTVDDLLREGIRGNLRGLSDAGAGALSLPALGITTNRAGRLELDEATFQSAVLGAPKEANVSLKALGARLEATIDTFAGSTGLIEVARTRSLAQLERYESSVTAIERRLEDRSLALTERYARIEGVLARLSTQGAVLTTLFPGG